MRCICQECGIEFNEKPARIKQGRGKFCSQICHNANRKSVRLKFSCNVCGTDFEANTSQVERGRTRYCSFECAIKAKVVPMDIRFWSKVNKTDSCWEWLGTLNDSGYGMIARGSKHAGSERAHRFSYQLHYGIDPGDLDVLHRCDNPKCVRPDHLFLGTQSDNINDAHEKGRLSSGDRHYSKASPERIPRGESRGHSKLTKDDVIVIRKRYADGNVTHRTLASEYGVTSSVICDIVNRKMWSHVP